MGSIKRKQNRLLITGILFLTTLVVQVNLVYACQIMNPSFAMSCCCEDMSSSSGCLEMEGGAETVQTDYTDCCHVQIDIKDSEQLSNSTSFHFGKNDAKQSQPPIYLLPISEFELEELNTVHYLLYVNHPSYHHGTDTYLVTQRFRE
jgi:hypothetical protein